MFGLLLKILFRIEVVRIREFCCQTLKRQHIHNTFIFFIVDTSNHFFFVLTILTSKLNLCRSVTLLKVYLQFLASSFCSWRDGISQLSYNRYFVSLCIFSLLTFLCYFVHFLSFYVTHLALEADVASRSEYS